MSEYNVNQLSVNENLISRKQAIEKVKAYKIFAPTDGVEKTLNAVIEAIAHSIAGLPAADVEPRWIPVTERLPELYTDVLLSVRQGYAFGEPDNWCVVGQLIDKADITWATNYGFHDLLYSNGKKHTVWVSAWMPLPSPYKEGEQR